MHTESAFNTAHCVSIFATGLRQLPPFRLDRPLSSVGWRGPEDKNSFLLTRKGERFVVSALRAHGRCARALESKKRRAYLTRPVQPLSRPALCGAHS